MARLKLRDGTISVSHGQTQFVADENGIIDTQDAPPSVVEALKRLAGAREATDEDEALADRAVAEKRAEELVASEKEQLLTQLRALGVTDVDGRKSIAVLQRKLAAAQVAAQKQPAKPQPPASPAAPPAAPVETTQGAA